MSDFVGTAAVLVVLAMVLLGLTAILSVVEAITRAVGG